MRREEFLRQLEMLLSDISEEERADAMAFYRSYFEDAGESNEARILEELGSPENVAEIIKRDLGMVAVQEADRSAHASTQGYDSTSGNVNADTQGYGSASGNASAGTQSCGNANGSGTSNYANSYGSYDEEHHTYTYTGGHSQGSNSDYTMYEDVHERAEQEKRSLGMLILIIAVAIITAPIWTGLLTGLFGIVFGGSVALVACTFALFVVGIAFISIAIPMIAGISGVVGLAFLGAGLLVLAFAILLLNACIWVFGKFFPWAVKSIVKFCKKLFHKNKEAQAA